MVQGLVYSSKAFSKAHKDYNILRSTSRLGTLTDSLIIKSINGWMKAEIRCDYSKEEKRILLNF